MILPIIAIVGRPNVGKSTLFNRLTQTNNALVMNLPGVTRDRIYGHGRVGDRSYMVIDTGGLGESAVELDDAMASQSWQAAKEADHIIFLGDAHAGVTAADLTLAQQLRAMNKPITLVVNKIDHKDLRTVVSDFYQLGLGEPVGIAAVQGRGVRQLMDSVLELLPRVDPNLTDEIDRRNSIKIAIIGRPNVGKSTLVNRVVGEERVVVFDEPGTTRDSIFVDFEREGRPYTIIDTAGIRRRARVSETLEKFSIIKSLEAVKNADVAIFLVDAQEGITDQDLNLLGMVLDMGRALILAVNKWDGLSEEDRRQVKEGLNRRLDFLSFIKIKMISALHGTGVGELFKLIEKAYEGSQIEMSTPRLTRLLEQAVLEHQPPLVRGRRIKLRYAHTGGHAPPIVVIHGNQLESLPDSYKRYLSKFFTSALEIEGNWVRIELKTQKNPYEGKKNTLTPRQQDKRKRLIRAIKRKEKKK